jgi:zinc transport system substrate-binding protein
MKGRKENRLVTSVLAFFMVSLILTLSCGKNGEVDQQDKIDVVVTIPPLADFVDGVGRDKVEVTVMVPPGASPHTYEPTPSQLKKVGKAKMYVMVGSGVEFELTWMDKIAAMNKKMLVVDASEGIRLLDMEGNHPGEEQHEEHEHKGKDPHIWLSPMNAKTMVQNICGGLIEVDPENEEYYIQNRNQYLDQLTELDRFIKERLEGIESRKFMVYHPSWGYLAKEYGLEQIPIEHAGKEPTAKEIKDAVEMAKKYDIKVIFVSPQSTTKSAEVIAKEIGGEIASIDPLAQSYIPNMRTVIEKLTQAMR